MTSIISLLSIFLNTLAKQQGIAPVEATTIGFSNDMCDENAVCQEWYEELASNPRFPDSLEVRDVTNGGVAEELRRTRSSDNSLLCPIFTEEYVRNASKKKDRSLSPWRWVINYDQNRRPMKIPETQCLCTGCIDPRTNRENKNLVSIPIKITHRVNYTTTGKEGLVTTQLGCRCDFPIEG